MLGRPASARTILAAFLAVAAGVAVWFAVAGVFSGPAVSGADRTATHAYLRARYELARSQAALLSASQIAGEHFVDTISRRCPNGLAKVPKSGPDSGQLSGRSQLTLEAIVGLNVARLEPLQVANEHFIGVIRALKWHDDGTTRLVRAFAAKEAATLTTPMPSLCRDLLTWMHSRYRTVPTGTTSSSAAEAADEKFSRESQADGYKTAHPEQVIYQRLARYADNAARLARGHTELLEQQVHDVGIRETAHEVSRLEQVLGLSPSAARWRTRTTDEA